MKKSKKETSLGRRRFLQSAGAAGMAAFVPPVVPANADAPQQPAASPGGPIEAARTDAVETALPPAPAVSGGAERNGSDFMVDVLKSIGFEYLPFTPSSDFRGLQESLVNYGKNRSPELLTCLHEEGAVAMAHGYYKVEERPLLVMVKEDQGLMHASMAVHNAASDRVPVYLITGGYPRLGPPQTPIVANLTKWHGRPASLPEFAEAAVRAYTIATTPPAGPVLLTVDVGLQENGIARDLRIQIPAVPAISPIVADSGAIAEVARLLVEASNPVILVSKLRTGAAMAPLVELAETLQAIVMSHEGLRTNFPSYHPLHRAYGSLADADLILGLETPNFWGAVGDVTRTGLAKKSPPLKARTISITTQNPANTGRYKGADLEISADAAATLPALVEAVKKLVTSDRRAAFAARGAKFAAAKTAALNQTRLNATYAWNSSPISMPRLSAELWDQLRHEDWAMVGWGHNQYYMDSSFWNFDKPYRSNGGFGGGGLGYGSPSAVGAALAHRKHGRLPVNIQNDGDFLFCPTALWTAAKYRIPILTVMRNNRAYQQEIMEVQHMCNQMNRGLEGAVVGCEIGSPNVDFGKLAQSFGVYGEGPIENPKDLAPAIKRAIAIVKRGEPALLDVIVQPR